MGKIWTRKWLFMELAKIKVVCYNKNGKAKCGEVERYE